MAISVEVLTKTTAVTEATDSARVISVVRQTQSPVTTNTGVAIIDVVGPPVLKNAVILPVEPSNPFEGMIWIDIS